MIKKKIVKNILRPVLTPLRPGNIVMFHIGRCGSTVLASLLRQHSRVFWASELYSNIFREWELDNDGLEVAGEMPVDAIVYLKENMKKAMHRYYGFEIKPFHFQLIDYSMQSFVEKLDESGFSYYIHLDRRNKLRKIVSGLIAHEDRMRYHQSGETKVKMKQVVIDINNVAIDYDSKPLLSFLTDYDKQVSSVKSLLQNRNCLTLTYEDDIQDDPRVGYRRICDFLGMKPKDVKVNLSRTNPFPVRNMIKNFEEVETVLKGTAYEWMLYD